jgi:hypothetical protein
MQLSIANRQERKSEQIMYLLDYKSLRTSKQEEQKTQYRGLPKLTILEHCGELKLTILEHCGKP